MDSVAVENYLKSLWQLGPADVSTLDLANHLNVAPASATKMVKRLTEKGLVNHTPYKVASLTSEGESKALSVVRRHRLLETFLSQTLDLGSEQLHDEAERLEHAVSDEVIGRMDMKLGNPQFDPHGDPIPQEDGRVPSIDKATCLAGLNVGDVGKVVRISHDEKTFLEYLNSISVGLNTEVCVNAYYDFDESFDVLFDGKSCHISGFASRHIWVL